MTICQITLGIMTLSSILPIMTLGIMTLSLLLPIMTHGIMALCIMSIRKVY